MKMALKLLRNIENIINISKIECRKFFEKKLYFSPLVILVLFIISACSIYLVIKTHEEYAANFADNILRPKIGSQSTIVIEAVFFKFEDYVNKLKYKFVKPDSSIFTHLKSTNTKIVIKKNPQFNLSSISLLDNFKPLTGEGVWFGLSSDISGIFMARTFVRPDPQRSYAIVALVKMNMNKLSIGSVAGIKEPGEKENPGSGKIPLNIQNSNILVAAFNGGFQKKDGYYGMIADGKVYLPLKKDLATLVIYQRRDPIIVKYIGQNFGSDVTAIRQNGPMLLENSRIVTSSDAWNMSTWGLTTTNTMYTWRSGIGITKNGNLIYACGPSLVPETLAKALLSAGAVNAMQLDINPIWVRFTIFDSLGLGKYTYSSLEPSMINGGYQYLHGYQKDFFYVYKKTE